MGAGVSGAIMVAGGWSGFTAVIGSWLAAPQALLGISAGFFVIALFFLPVWLLLRIADALDLDRRP
jgi:hypothetical protein